MSRVGSSAGLESETRRKECPEAAARKLSRSYVVEPVQVTFSAKREKPSRTRAIFQGGLGGGYGACYSRRMRPRRGRALISGLHVCPVHALRLRRNDSFWKLWLSACGGPLFVGPLYPVVRVTHHLPLAPPLCSCFVPGRQTLRVRRGTVYY